MTRDDDLIRELLFRYEADENWLIPMPGDTLGASAQKRRENYHVHLMMDERLVAPVGRGTIRLTSAGHDYLSAIRDDASWNRTKAGAAEVGGMTLGLMKDVAVAELRQQAEEKRGIKL